MRVIEKIQKAIKEINPDAEFIIRGTSGDTATVDGVEWEDGTTPIAKSDIEAKMIEVQDGYDAQAYARSRKAEYPSIADQLDDIYHNGVDGWKTTIKVTKDKYPKG
tara:strand:- start:7 stop:324 length:318 start_codon:yes stop_codon:yes gene_type:complete